ncbi:hypothetical protein KAR91_21390 [Candidatus Pacearchaeota archaeon]|nr:hypothetical protein [Candidatus Pacearchaeota archaeon]
MKECEKCHHEFAEEVVRSCSECNDTICTDCAMEGPDGDICEGCLGDIEKAL